MQYEGNPKHKEPWQPGRKGTLCPKMEGDRTASLLKSSALNESTRYTTDGERAYAAHEHAIDRWHGHPVGWVEVPEPVRRAWLAERRITRAMMKKFWTLE